MWKQIMISILFLLVLMACDNKQKQQNIQNQVAIIKKQTVAVNEPLPLLPTISSAAYQAALLKDPFQPSQKATNQNEPRFNLSRKKQPLERYSINSLKMVGTIKKNVKFLALILAPDKSIYPISVGQFIGKNHGRVTEITLNKIKFEEKILIKNIWKERERQLVIQHS